MSDNPWAAVHHEDAEPEPAEKPKTAAKPKPKSTAASKEPALVLTIPPTFAAAMWSLSEALKENTEAVKSHTEELRLAREGGGETGI